MLRRYRDRFRHRPSDSDSYDPMPRKPHTSAVAPQTAISRTLHYAQQGPLPITSAGKASHSYGNVAPFNSSSARYWAARAVTAEVLLAERNKHAQELRSVIHEEDAKRREEIASLHGAHEARQRRMEWMMIGCIAVLAVVVLCVLVTQSRAPHTPPASHFTIPVLSPFTSVVEHETSAWGARIIVPGLMVAALLAWGVFRQWISVR